METILSALIGGIFSLAGVWLGHYLQTHRRVDARSQAARSNDLEQSSARPRSTGPYPTRSKSRGTLGCSLLAADFVFMIAVVNIFDLNSKEPWWENYFAFLCIGAIPAYSLFLLLSGLLRAIRQKSRVA